MALYFEDLEVGQLFESVERTVTEHDVISFAGITVDFNHLHTEQ